MHIQLLVVTSVLAAGTLVFSIKALAPKWFIRAAPLVLIGLAGISILSTYWHRYRKSAGDIFVETTLSTAILATAVAMIFKESGRRESGEKS